MRSAETLLLLLLLLPVATAVSNVELVKNGETFTWAAPGSSTELQVRFVPSPDAEVVILQNEQGEVTSINPETCAETCVTEPLTFVLSTQITIEVLEENSEGAQPSSLHTITLNIDDSKPEITRVGTPDCRTGSVCYYGPQNKTVEFEVYDQGSGLNLATARIRAGSEEHQANCTPKGEQVLCRAELTTGGTKDVSVYIEDQVGNTQTSTTTINYDSIAPSIAGTILLNEYPTGEVIGGQPLTITIPVEEELLVTASYEGTLIETSEGECNRRGSTNQFECTIRIVPPNVVDNETGTITIRDAAGNTEEQSITLNILQGDPDAQPNYWTARITSKDRIDPHTTRFLATTYDLDLRLIPEDRYEGTNIEPFRLEGGCALPGYSKRPITPQKIGRNMRLAIEIPATGSATTSDSPLFNGDIECDLQIVTKQGNTVYSSGETETVSITPEFTSLPPPGVAVTNRKNQIAEEIASKQRFFQTSNAIVTSLQGVCGAAAGIETATGPLLAAAQAVQGVAGVGPGISAGLRREADTVDGAAAKVHESSNVWCRAITCDQSIVDVQWGEIPGFDGVISDLSSAVAGTVETEQVLDPYKSIYLAMAQQCVPAILYQYQLGINNKCQYQSCITNLGTTGSSLRECDINRDYLECRYQYGNIVNAIPHINALDSIRDQFVAAFDNPFGLLGLAQSILCSVADIGCAIHETTDKIAKYTALGQQAVNSVDRYRNFLGQGGDYCGTAAQALNRPPIPPQYSYGEEWCRGGICMFESNRVEGKIISTSRGAYYIPPGAEPVTVSNEGDIVEILGGGAAQPINEEGQITNEEGEQIPIVGTTTLEQFLEAAKNNREFAGVDILIAPGGEMAPDPDSDLYGAIQGARQARDEWAEATERRDDIQEEIGNNAGASHLAQQCAEVGGPNCGNLQEMAERQEELVQEQAAQEQAVAEAEEEFEEQAERVREEALKSEYDSIRGSVRRYLATMRTYGQIGTFLDAELGINPLGFIGDSVNEDYHAFIENSVGWTDIDSVLVDQFCSLKQEAPLYTGAFRGEAGEQAVRLAALKRAVDTGTDSGYQYVVEAYVQVADSPDETAQLFLLRGARTYEFEPINLNGRTTRVGASADRYPVEGEPLVQENFDRVCIRFPRQLSRYDITGPGVDEGGNMLCSRIVEVES